jgi:hypothetical protein
MSLHKRENLSNDFTRIKVSDEAGAAGGTIDAAHRAADLTGYAERGSLIVVMQHHGLNACLFFDGIEVFNRIPVPGVERPGRIEIVESKTALQLLSEPLGQVGHAFKGLNLSFIYPRKHLIAVEFGKSMISSIGPQGIPIHSYN